MGTPAIDPNVLAKVSLYAERYSINYTEFYKTIRCESGFDPLIQSQHITSTGEREQSFGIAQINLPYHPTITKEQALDPDFSLDFMAREFSKGNQGLWTCYKDLFR